MATQSSARPILALASTVLLGVAIASCRASEERSQAASRPASERMDWWREARFGLFLHWGLYAVPAGEWNGATGHGEWIMNTAHIPVERYEQFREQFNPVKFDARAWVALAKQAGMRYIVITSKHHDGFCLFDSPSTDYDVMSTPFHRDILRELSAACAAEGIRLCWYHSIMDWHHPDYLPRRDWETRPSAGASFPRYVEHLRDQVRELLTRYGPIGVMWFDGEWESTWTHEYGKELYALCRELQPDVIVNNRVDVSRGGMSGFSSGDDAAGDFGTPEQEVPATGVPGVDWETCMTMNDHWGYNRRDEHWKSSAELIRTLVDIASKGGNFLLNVGPTAEGEFPAASVERLRDIGRWMDVNGEAIHGTTASPWETLAWGRCTQRSESGSTTLYLHVFDWPADGVLVLPGLVNESVRASLLADFGQPLAVSRRDSDTLIALPPRAPDAVCSVVALEIRGRPLVHEAPRIEAASDVLVRSLEVRLASRSGAEELRYTLDGSPPTADSARYVAPIAIQSTTLVQARAFEDRRAVSSISKRQFTQVAPLPSTPVANTAPGLVRQTFLGEWDRLPDFGGLQPSSSSTAAAIALEPSSPGERIAQVFTGWLTVPADDVYIFALVSDDGSKLLIDGQLVADNDGLHSSAERRGSLALAAGAHALRVEWFNKTGDVDLAVRMGASGKDPQPIPAGSLSHAP
jgi:alpha-L-fucosidase